MEMRFPDVVLSWSVIGHLTSRDERRTSVRWKLHINQSIIPLTTTVPVRLPAYQFYANIRYDIEQFWTVLCKHTLCNSRIIDTTSNCPDENAMLPYWTNSSRAYPFFCFTRCSTEPTGIGHLSCSDAFTATSFAVKMREGVRWTRIYLLIGFK